MEYDEKRRTWWVLAVGVAAGFAVASAAGCDDERSASAEAPSAPGERTGRSGAAAETDDESGGGSDERYTAVVAPESIPAGRSTTVRLEIAAGDGLKVNKEYPTWGIEVEEAQGIELEKRSFSRKDFELRQGSATAEASVRGTDPGDATIAGTANFSVCNDETCHIMRDESVRFRVRVENSSADDSNKKAK